VETHALLIQQEYYRRRMYEASQKVKNLSGDPMNDVADIIEIAQKEIETITEQAYRKDDNISLRESAYNAFQNYFEREKAAKQGLTTGIETGVPLLNKLSGGWQDGNLIIIAARPAMGKTSFALHMAKSAAKQGFCPAIFSLEMSHIELSNKLILSESDIDPTRFKNGGLSSNEVSELEKGTNEVYDLSIIINDQSGITVRQIKNTAKLLKKQGKCDVVFIDYLQLLNMKQDNKNYNRENEVSQTSRALKLMAKELEIPVIVLSQLSRNCEERANKRPLLSDLRESGAIEQDADLVLFLFRPEYYDIHEYEGKDTKGMLIIDIAKGRNLPTCEIEFAYNERFTKFFDPAIEKPF
jgi:replicative DNA helicase